MDLFDKNEDGIAEWFEQGDIVLVDRGFRDSINFLENKGLICKMPQFINVGQKQFNKVEENEARLITKSRWVVEVRNGHFQSIFRFFIHVVPFAQVLHLRDYYQIAGAIINRYRAPLLMPDATVDIAREMKLKVNDVNVVQMRVEVEGLKRGNANWRRLNENHALNFPRLNIEYLKRLTVGIFQLNVAPSYIQDKLNKENSDIFQFDEYSHESGFLRIRIYSRSVNRTKHQLWIAYTLKR